MIRGRALLFLMGLVVALFAVPTGASARGGPPCHAGASLSETYRDVAARPQRWTCEDADWAIDQPRVFLRFHPTDLDGPHPQYLVTRLTRFDRMDVTVIARDGQSAARSVTQAAMTPATSDWLMTTPLPVVAGPPATVIVRVDGARHSGMLSAARLTSEPSGQRSFRFELAIAALCGLLFAPLVFNLAFYGVLRQKFLLWHSVAALFMLLQTVLTSGLINRFAHLSITQLCVYSALTWAGGVGAAALFLADVLEPGKIDSRNRRLLQATPAWIGAWTLFYLMADGPLRALAEPYYFLSFVPVLFIFAATMAIAKQRGSRAANFQIAAWLPIMATGALRIVSVLGVTGAPLELQMEQHLSIGLEVMITALGVIDRFLVIRRQRDGAQARARMFEDRSERDSLTGLMNRRGIEERFPALYAEGFRTMALIDLDRFKQVNDTHGHGVGDEVLKSAAQALAPDGDTLAVRLGGEEFMLLMRGKDAVARAERRRQAIPVRVAGDVAGLQQVVTASMGLVQHPARSAISADFRSLYAHCDRLLYDAKAAGRNRTMRERVQSFGMVRQKARV